MTRPGRIPCCVPFCRRTASQERYPGSTQSICGPHWRTAPEFRRRVYRRASRAWTAAAARQIGPDSYASLADHVAAHRAGRRVVRLWFALRREIIEIAAGIARAA